MGWLTQRANKICRLDLSATTRTQREGLSCRLNAFARRYGQDPGSEKTACLFVASLRVSPASALTYLSHLRQILHPRSMFDRFALGLRRMKANTDSHGARPIPVTQLYYLVDRETLIQGQMFLYLAWRTASRLNEIDNLSAANFLEISRTHIIIWWGTTTKSSQIEPRQARFLTVLVPPLQQERMPLWLVAVGFCRQFNGWPPNTRGRISRALKEVGCTDHSVKTGAIAHLLSLAAQNLLPLSLVSLLAKHKSGSQEIADTTIGYANTATSLKDVALSLRTQDATKWL